MKMTKEVKEAVECGIKQVETLIPDCKVTVEDVCNPYFHVHITIGDEKAEFCVDSLKEYWCVLTGFVKGVYIARRLTL